MIDHTMNTNNESELVLSSDVLRGLTDGVYIVDRDRRILFWNQAAEQLTGFKAIDVVGSCCKDDILRHVDCQGQCLCENGCLLAEVIKDGIPRDSHIFLNHKNGHRVPVHVRGTPIFDADKKVIACVEVFSDDTQRLSMMDQLAQLENQALLDPLTGLANHRHFDESLSKALNRYQRHNKDPFGLILVNIDHFKKVNDFYGQDVGNKLIALVARTLCGHCRAYDTAARRGGDEFALVIEQIDETTLTAMANRMRNTINRSALEHNECHISVSVSIGLTIAQPEDDAESILKRANERLHTAKEGGRDQIMAE